MIPSLKQAFKPEKKKKNCCPHGPLFHLAGIGETLLSESNNTGVVDMNDLYRDAIQPWEKDVI